MEPHRLLRAKSDAYMKHYAEEQTNLLRGHLEDRSKTHLETVQLSKHEEKCLQASRPLTFVALSTEPLLNLLRWTQQHTQAHAHGKPKTAECDTNQQLHCLALCCHPTSLAMLPLQCVWRSCHQLPPMVAKLASAPLPLHPNNPNYPYHPQDKHAQALTCAKILDDLHASKQLTSSQFMLQRQRLTQAANNFFKGTMVHLHCPCSPYSVALFHTLLVCL